MFKPRLLTILLIFSGFIFCCEPRAQAFTNSPLEKTQTVFRQVLCMDQDRYLYYRDVIRAFSYTRMRALRAFCSLPYFTADQAISTLEQLVFYPVGFEQVKLLEHLAATGTANEKDCWQLLGETAGMEFTAMQAAAAAGNIKGLTPQSLFIILDSLREFDDSGRWAAEALFELEGIDAETALRGLAAISSMTGEQQRTAEKASRLEGGTSASAIEIIDFIASTTANDDAATIGGLFSIETMSARDGLFWLHHYFSGHGDKEMLFRSLPTVQKSTLLTAFSQGAEYLIRKINDLHAVTNDFGTELSTNTLAAKDSEELELIFEKLHPDAKAKYRTPFLFNLRENNKYKAVENLKNATSLTRRLTARDLTSANIYILLSHGSELYDSSFRDILVPVLVKRISRDHQANLLKFLLETDPENSHASDFIVSCAQKGKLTAFFPEHPAEQRKILDLVTASAFKNEQSLILFAATFNALLEELRPSARSYLIETMAGTITRPDSAFSIQLRVILQHYRKKHPDLLSPTDISVIDSLIVRYGAIDLTPYTLTDFTRWKKDGKLISLSIFQQDDDGSISYRSNMLNLVENGYLPRLSKLFSLLPPGDPAEKEAIRLIVSERKMPGSQVRSLFRLSARSPVVVEWYKTVNNVELSHAVTVYRDRHTQERLLKQFMKNDVEMFAQRGHSYWRRSQVLWPMKKLQERGEIINEDITRLNRFMSVGSCGGIRIYSELNKLFDNRVDIFATVGTGKAAINDSYNQRLFEIVAESPDNAGWDRITGKTAPIFAKERESDYLQPGSLPAILYKMMDDRKTH